MAVTRSEGEGGATAATRVGLETESHETAVIGLRGCADAIDTAVGDYARLVSTVAPALLGQTATAYLAAEGAWVAEMTRLVQGLRVMADAAATAATSIAGRDEAVAKALG